MGLNHKQKPRFLLLVIQLMLEVNSALVTFTEGCFVNPEHLYYTPIFTEKSKQ